MAYIHKKYSELDAYIPTLTAGTYDLEVDCRGETYLLEFGSKLNTAKADVFFRLKPINIESAVAEAFEMFSRCTRLTSIDCSGFTSVTTADYMFNGCTRLTSIDCSGFTSVTIATSMFYSCSSLTSIKGAEAFNKVTEASGMFYRCTGLTSIDTSSFTSVTSAIGMFQDCTGLTTLTLGSAFSGLESDRLYKGCTSLNTIRCANNPELTKANLIKNKGNTGFPDTQITSWQKLVVYDKPPIMKVVDGYIDGRITNDENGRNIANTYMPRGIDFKSGPIFEYAGDSAISEKEWVVSEDCFLIANMCYSIGGYLIKVDNVVVSGQKAFNGGYTASDILNIPLLKGQVLLVKAQDAWNNTSVGTHIRAYKYIY